MAFSYLTEDNLYELWRKSKDYMKPFQDPIDEFDRIARNLPHPDIAANLPKVTDGTTSSIIQKTPRRIIQQLPTGVVKSDTNDWLTLVASFILLKKIIPNANEQFALIQKDWHTVKKGLSYGSQTVLVQFVARGDYFGTDITIPWIKDIFYEPGKVSDMDSNYMFVRAWYQPSDIEAIIHQEKELAKRAKERGEKYESEWDLKALESIKTELTAKPDDQMSTEEREKQNNLQKAGIEIVHGFQDGKDAVFYSFNPKTETCVRKRVNKDPRGLKPTITFYADIDGSNPLGWGLAEQLGPLQNLIDSEMQMYQFNRALMLAPPMVKKGNYSKSQIKWAPNAIIDMGIDPNASLDPLTVDTSAIVNFAQNYGLMKSQLLNLAASPDTSISSEVGNPGFSKTPAGVNAQMANVSVDDNYIRKQFEAFKERVYETMINLYFAERSGVEELQLDKDTANKLRKLAEQGKFDPTLLSEDNKIMIDYDTATPALKFEVDASSSNMQDDSKQLEALDALMERYNNSPILQQLVPTKKALAAWNAIVAASGVENPEELQVSDEEQEELEAQQAEEAAAMEEQALMSGEVAPEEGMPVEESLGEEPALSPEEEIASIEAQLAELDAQEAEAAAADPEEEMFIQALTEMGYDEDRIGRALAMLDHGMEEDDILEAIGPVEAPEELVNG